MSEMYKQEFINKHGSMADEFSHIGPIGDAIWFLVGLPRILTIILIIITFSLYTQATKTNNKKEQQGQTWNLFYLSLVLTIISIVWNVWITGWFEIPQSQRWRAKLFANDKALGTWEKYRNAQHQEEVQRELSEIRRDRYDRNDRYENNSTESSLTGALINAALR